jgi:hypothetical protein
MPSIITEIRDKYHQPNLAASLEGWQKRLGESRPDQWAKVIPVVLTPYLTDPRYGRDELVRSLTVVSEAMVTHAHELESGYPRAHHELVGLVVMAQSRFIHGEEHHKKRLAHMLSHRAIHWSKEIKKVQSNLEMAYAELQAPFAQLNALIQRRRENHQSIKDLARSLSTFKEQDIQIGPTAVRMLESRPQAVLTDQELDWLSQVVERVLGNDDNEQDLHVHTLPIWHHQWTINQELITHMENLVRLQQGLARKETAILKSLQDPYLLQAHERMISGQQASAVPALEHIPRAA